MPHALATTPRPEQPDTATMRRLLTDHLPLVDRIVGRACYRTRMPLSDAEDFAAHARLKLVENDYHILRKFQGRGDFAAYLTTVVERLLLDYRSTIWGRWRPSAEALRSGPMAVLIDRLLTRDGLSVDQAYQLLRTNHQATISRETLDAIVARLPARTRPRLVNDDLSEVPATSGLPDVEFDRTEASRRVGPIADALKDALRGLPAEDRRLLEMRFREGRQVAEIARTLGVEAAPLYRQLERIVAVLRRLLHPYVGTPVLDMSISW